MQDFIRIGGPIVSSPLNENFRRMANAIDMANTNMIFSEEDGVKNTIDDMLDIQSPLNGQVCYVVSSGEFYRYSTRDNQWHKIMDIGQTFRQGFLNSGAVMIAGALTRKDDTTITIPDMLVYFKNKPGDDRYLKGMYYLTTHDIDLSQDNYNVTQAGTYSIYTDELGGISIDKGLPIEDSVDRIFLGAVLIDGDLHIIQFKKNNEVIGDGIYTIPDIAFTADRGHFIVDGGQASGLNLAVTGTAPNAKISRAEGFYYDEGMGYTNVIQIPGSYPAETDKGSNFNFKRFVEESEVTNFIYMFPHNALTNDITVEDGIVYDQYVIHNSQTETDTKTPIVGAGHFTIQQHLVLPDGLNVILYGNELYNSFDDAYSHINDVFGVNIDFPYVEASRLIVGTKDVEGQVVFDITDPDIFRIISTDRLSQIGTFTPVFSDAEFKVYSAKGSDTTPASIKFDLINLEADDYQGGVGFGLVPLHWDVTRDYFGSGKFDKKYITDTELKNITVPTATQRTFEGNTGDEAGYELADNKDLDLLADRTSDIEKEIWAPEARHTSGGFVHLTSGSLIKNNSQRTVNVDVQVREGVLNYYIHSTSSSNSWISTHIKLEYSDSVSQTWHTLYEGFNAQNLQVFPAGKNTYYNNTYSPVITNGTIIIRLIVGQGSASAADRIEERTMVVQDGPLPLYQQSIRYRLYHDELDIAQLQTDVSNKVDKSFLLNGHALSGNSLDLVTGDIAEGSGTLGHTNLWYTDARVEANNNVATAYAHVGRKGHGTESDANPHAMSTDDITVGTNKFVTQSQLDKINNLPADTEEELSHPINVYGVPSTLDTVTGADYGGAIKDIKFYDYGFKLDINPSTKIATVKINNDNVMMEDEYAIASKINPALYSGAVDRALAADTITGLNGATENQYYGTDENAVLGVYDLPVYVSTGDAEEYTGADQTVFQPIDHSVVLKHLANSRVSYPASYEESQIGTNVYDLVKYHYHKVYNSGTQGPYISGTTTQDTSEIYYSYKVPSGGLSSGVYYFSYGNNNYRFTLSSALTSGKELIYTPSLDKLSLDGNTINKSSVQPEVVDENKWLPFVSRTSWNNINEWNFGDNLTVTVTDGRATINAAVAGTGASNFANLADVDVTYTDADLGKTLILDKDNSNNYKIKLSSVNMYGYMKIADYASDSVNHIVRQASLADTATMALTANKLQDTYTVNDGSQSSTTLWTSNQIVSDVSTQIQNEGVRTYSGTSQPSASLGKDGDLYILLES